MNQESGENKIKSFTDLNVWREGHKLVLKIYSVTKQFPNEEIFGLSNQMRRSAVSVTSNIAEGFSRISFKEKVQFYSMVLASLTELQNQLLISKDVKYISLEQFRNLAQRSVVVHKLINGLIKSSRLRSHNS